MEETVRVVQYVAEIDHCSVTEKWIHMHVYDRRNGSSIDRGMINRASTAELGGGGGGGGGMLLSLNRETSRRAMGYSIK